MKKILLIPLILSIFGLFACTKENTLTEFLYKHYYDDLRDSSFQFLETGIHLINAPDELKDMFLDSSLKEEEFQEEISMYDNNYFKENTLIIINHVYGSGFSYVSVKGAIYPKLIYLELMLPMEATDALTHMVTLITIPKTPIKEISIFHTYQTSTDELVSFCFSGFNVIGNTEEEMDPKIISTNNKYINMCDEFSILVNEKYDSDFFISSKLILFKAIQIENSQLLYSEDFKSVILSISNNTLKIIYYGNIKSGDLVLVEVPKIIDFTDIEV